MGDAPSVTVPHQLRGRARELSDLTAAIDDAKSGHGSVLCVVGAPGIGKTAILETVLPEMDGCVVLRTCGVEPESALPLAGLQRLLRPVRGCFEELPEDQATVLTRALESGRAREDERLALPVAVLALLTRLSSATPLVCCVDDAHLMDTASLDVLAFAARRLDRDAVAMLFFARGGGASRHLSGLPTLRLPPLPDDVVAGVLTEASGNGITEAVRHELVRVAYGNPLAARGLVAQLTPGQLAGTELLRVPPALGVDVRHAYAAGVSSLPAATRRLLLLAAAEENLEVDVAARAAGRTVADLEPAEVEGVVTVDNGRIVFCDPLLRDAIYQSASLARRRSAHTALTRALEGERYRSRRIWHRAAATGEPDAELADELAATADTARELSGHRASSVIFERAADLSVTPALQACRLSIAAHEASVSGRPHRAQTLSGRVRTVATTPEVRGLADLVDGNLTLRTGNALGACDQLVEAARQLAASDRGLAARALLRAADASSFAGDFARYSQIAAWARDLCDEGSSVAELETCYLAGSTAAFAGDYHGALRPLRRVLELSTRTTDPANLLWASVAAGRLGDEARAHTLASSAAELAQRRGAASTIPQSMEFLVYSEFWSGRYPSATQHSLTGLRLARETGQPNCVAHHLAALALLSAIQGDEENCLIRSRAATEQIGEKGLGLPTALNAWARGFLDLSYGRASEAVGRFRTLARAEPGHGHRTVRLLSAPHFVEAAARTGEYGRARSALEEYARWAETTGSPGPRAVTSRCHALLTDGEQAWEHFDEALRLHRRSGAGGVEEARTLLSYGAALRRARFPSVAREHLRHALEMFERLETSLWVERVRAELRAAGEPVPGGRAGSAQDLTPQQLRIAELVAQGATNREIAAHLFVSPRTVEHHLRNVFQRVGVRSRVELARLLS